MATLTGAANEPSPTPPAPWPSSVTRFSPPVVTSTTSWMPSPFRSSLTAPVGCEPTVTGAPVANAHTVALISPLVADESLLRTERIR